MLKGRDGDGERARGRRDEPEQFESDAKMRSKVEMFFDVNDVQGVVHVEILQMSENVHFDETLLLKAFLVPNDFQSDRFFLLVIVTTENESEGTFAQRLQDFESITNVIFADLDERAILVVVIFDTARRDLLGF